MKTTYAWVAKPNSGNYTKTRIGSHQTRRDFFALYAGITTKERVEDRFTKYEFPDGNIYKSDIDVVSTEKFEDLGDLEAKFQEQLYINATRDAADYLKEKGIDAKFFNRSESVRHYGYYLNMKKQVYGSTRYTGRPYDELYFATPSGTKQSYDSFKRGPWGDAYFLYSDEEFPEPEFKEDSPERQARRKKARENQEERINKIIKERDLSGEKRFNYSLLRSMPSRMVSLAEFSQNLKRSATHPQGAENAIHCGFLDLNKKSHKEILSILADDCNLNTDFLDCDGENAGYLYVASGFFKSDLYKFLKYCRDKNNDSLRDEKVYEKLIKDVSAYHNQNYSDENMKQPEQNNHAEQLIETIEEVTKSTTREALSVANEAVEAAQRVLGRMDKLVRANEKLKEEKDQMEYEYLLTIGKLMAALDQEELKKFMQNDLKTARSAFGTLVNERGPQITVREFLNNCREWGNKE